MRRLHSVDSSGKRWVVFVTLCVVLAAWLSAIGSTNAQPSPTPSPDATPTPVIIPIDVVEYPDDFILYLMRVEFGPNVPAPPPEIHGGEFVLTVHSGAVCYELTNVDATTTVTANLLEGAAPNDDCNPNQIPGCVEDTDTHVRTCKLDSGDKVYVPAGSWVTQEGATPNADDVAAEHTYGNVDDELAVVYLAGYQFDTGAGCKGGCY